MNHSADGSFSRSRRGAIQTIGATAMLAVAPGAGSLPDSAEAAAQGSNESDGVGSVFWPNGARLAVSFSLMFEGGGQPRGQWRDIGSDREGRSRSADERVFRLLSL